MVGSGVKMRRQKQFFYLFLAYFYMKRSRSRWKKVPGAAAVPKKGPVLQHCIGPTNTHDFTCFFPLLLNYFILQFKPFPQHSPPPPFFLSLQVLLVSFILFIVPPSYTSPTPLLGGKPGLVTCDFEYSIHTAISVVIPHAQVITDSVLSNHNLVFCFHPAA